MGRYGARWSDQLAARWRGADLGSSGLRIQNVVVLYEAMPKRSIGEPLFLSVREAAEIAGVHYNTIRRWAAASERRAAAGLEPDFIVSKPAGVRNGRLRIHRASFLAYMKRMVGGGSRMAMAPYRGPNIFLELGIILGDLLRAKPHGGPSIG
jgi:hypothetical protein